MNAVDSIIVDSGSLRAFLLTRLIGAYPLAARASMRIGEEHCRDQLNVVTPHVGLMRRLRDEEHTTCVCGGTWVGNGYARMWGNKLLDHLICTRCGYRWVTDHNAIKAGFAVPD